MDIFLETPYIPNKAVKAVIVDYRISAKAEKTLQMMDIDVIKTVPCMDLYDSINGHPDILMHHLGKEKIVVAPNVYGKLAPILIKKGFAVTKGATWLLRNYPNNVAYNVMRIGNIAFHNTKHTDRTILEYFEKEGIVIEHVKQGYTKCSVCIVDNKSMITSDKKIAQKCEKYDIECMVISPGGIVLEGLEYGFIGGAAGLIGDKKIAFTGVLNNHKDIEKIYEFLFSKGITVKTLSEKQIIDIGSIVPLNY